MALFLHRWKCIERQEEVEEDRVAIMFSSHAAVGCLSNYYGCNLHHQQLLWRSLSLAEEYWAAAYTLFFVSCYNRKYRERKREVSYLDSNNLLVQWCLKYIDTYLYTCSSFIHFLQAQEKDNFFFLFLVSPLGFIQRRNYYCRWRGASKSFSKSFRHTPMHVLHVVCFIMSALSLVNLPTKHRR